MPSNEFVTKNITLKRFIPRSLFTVLIKLWDLKEHVLPLWHSFTVVLVLCGRSYDQLYYDRGLAAKYWRKAKFFLLENMPAFVPVMFEMTVFFAAHLMVITFYMRSKLWPFKEAENPNPLTTDDKFLVVEIHGQRKRS